MKGIILYYSSTGNTKLACEYIARKATNISFELRDIVREKQPDLAAFDLAGFACFADYIGPSKVILDLINSLPLQTRKPAFVFSTYGSFNGATLRVMTRRVKSKGFSVVAGHGLHAPENIPIMIKAGRAELQAPNPDELAAFDRFNTQLNQMAADSAKNGWPSYRPPFLDRLVPMLPRTMARKQMGEKFVNAALCTRCGICAKDCPYGAIALKDLPAFDQQKCYGCWACYNCCPTKAIYTKKIRGIGHYPAPIERLRQKLTV